MTARRMRLHGGPLSPFVRKVGIVLIEKGLAEQVEFIRSPAAMMKANVSLMKLNPLSKIPVLEIGEQALFDSDVICEYLDTQYPQPSLLPASGAARWQALRWNALASGALDALVLWRFELNRATSQQSSATLQTYAEKLHATLALIEAESNVWQSTAFGIAQIAMGCLFGYLDFRFTALDWRAAQPRCATWYAAFMQRASARATIPYEQAYPLADVQPLWSPV